MQFHRGHNLFTNNNINKSLRFSLNNNLTVKLYNSSIHIGFKTIKYGERVPMSYMHKIFS